MRSFFLSSIAASAMAADGYTDFSMNGMNWPDLCQTGKEQSPIDLSDMKENSMLSLDLQGYEDFSGSVINKGTTFQVDFEKDSNPDAMMTLVRGDGEVQFWRPLQFHFHAPSEHTIGGRQMDLEVHFVHLSEEGELGAVLGVFFDREEGGNYHNDFLDSLDLSLLPSGMVGWSTNGQIPLDDLIDIAEESAFASYDGSLTTPPCTEGVKWTVSMNVRNISDEQLDYISRTYADNYDFAKGTGNFRVTQPLHGRNVWYKGAEGSLYEDMGAATISAAALALVALLNF